MSKKPPNRPGIEFEVGARLEAQDCLQKWYSSRIEKIDYEEGKMLVHFERWNHRYDEWIFWDSSRLRPLERPALRKEGLKDEEELFDFKPGEEVLARWTDCRYYPAKIEAMSPEGTYTVQFYDGVIRCLKKMHIKCMPDDARGQDWIALVKAAAAAVGIKSKAGGKPRTSANSNKEKEDKKSLKVSLTKEETSISKTLKEVLKKEEAPMSCDALDFPLVDAPLPLVDAPLPLVDAPLPLVDAPLPLVDAPLPLVDASLPVVDDPFPVLDVPIVEVPNAILAETETSVSVKRKKNEGNSFQAKRARLNKITGLLASKAVVVEDAVKNDSEKRAPGVGQAIPANLENQKNCKAVPNSAMTRKPSLLPTALSSKKVRSRKAKYESGVSLVSKVPSPLPARSPPLVQNLDEMRVPPLPPTVIKETCEHRLFPN